METKSWIRACLVVSIVSLGAVGASACKFDGKPRPVEKTSVGRVVWPDGGIGGGPATSDTPNSIGSEVVPGDDMTSTVTESSSSASVSPATSSSARRRHHGDPRGAR